MNIFGKRSDLPFSRENDHAWFRLRMSRILFAAKHSWTTLRMSRPLFVGSYLQVTWWALGQWKGRKICNEWWWHLVVLVSLEYPGFQRLFFPGTLLNRQHDLFYTRYFENGPLEPGYSLNRCCYLFLVNFQMFKRWQSVLIFLNDWFLTLFIFKTAFWRDK